MTSRSGVIVKVDELKHWHEILLRWCAILEQHCRIAPDERPWWALEQGQASLFASAAIQSGYAALVEADGTKGDGEKKGGRSDLWVQFGAEATKGACQEVLEFKTHGPAITAANVSTVRSKLEGALADARKVSLSLGFRARIGVACFIVACAPGEFAGLVSLREQIEKECDPEAMAWVFVDALMARSVESGLLHPGGVLVMRRV